MGSTLGSGGVKGTAGWLPHGEEAWLLGFAVLVSFSTMASVYGGRLPGSVEPSVWASLASRVAQVVACLGVALAGARGRSLAHAGTTQLACVMACSLAVLLPSLAGAMSPEAALVRAVLANGAPFLRACGFVILWLAWMELFSRLDLRHMLVDYLLVHVVSAALSFVLGSLPLPGVALGALLVAMPWAAWGTFVRARSVVERASYACGESEPHPWSFPVVPVVLMAAFSTTNLFVHGMLPGTTSVYATAGVVVACLAVLLVVRTRGVGSFDVWGLASAAFMLTLAGLMGTHVTGAFWAVAASLCTNAGSSLFNVFLCVTLCNVSYRYGVSSMVLFGFSKSADCLAYVIGTWLVGMAGGSGNAFALSVAGLAVVLAASFVALVGGRERREGGPSWGVGLDMRVGAASAEGGARVVAGVPGRAPDSGRALDGACATLARECGLTRREEDVLRLLARDLPAADIEQALCVSNPTVKTHTQACYRKLGVHSRREIVELVGDRAAR